jgi:hypothetical protein
MLEFHTNVHLVILSTKGTVRATTKFSLPNPEFSTLSSLETQQIL